MTSRPPLVVAHRGNSSVFTENTLPAFRSAWELPGVAVELDIRCTRDRVPVIIHDSTTRRIFGLQRVIALSRAISLQQQFPELPALAPTLASGPADCTWYLECKVESCVYKSVEIVKSLKLSADQIVWISFNPRVLQTLATTAPHSQRYLLAAPPANPLLLIRRAHKCAATGVDIRFEPFISPRYIQTLREYALSIHVWTLDTPGEIQRALNLSVDSITTNCPKQVSQWVQSGLPRDR